MADSSSPAHAGAPVPARAKRWMAVLARAARPRRSADQLAACPGLPGWRVLRGPESGLVMVRGRAGGGGAPFNLGEMTVTRCTVRTGSGPDGFTGHAYVAGRAGRQAELAAAVDALLQDTSAACVAATASSRRSRLYSRRRACRCRSQGGGHQGAVLRAAEHAFMT